MKYFVLIGVLLCLAVAVSVADERAEKMAALKAQRDAARQKRLDAKAQRSDALRKAREELKATRLEERNKKRAERLARRASTKSCMAEARKKCTEESNSREERIACRASVASECAKIVEEKESPKEEEVEENVAPNECGITAGIPAGGRRWTPTNPKIIYWHDVDSSFEYGKSIYRSACDHEDLFMQWTGRSDPVNGAAVVSHRSSDGLATTRTYTENFGDPSRKEDGTPSDCTFYPNTGFTSKADRIYVGNNEHEYLKEHNWDYRSVFAFSSGETPHASFADGYYDTNNIRGGPEDSKLVELDRWVVRLARSDADIDFSDLVSYSPITFGTSLFLHDRSPCGVSFAFLQEMNRWKENFGSSKSDLVSLNGRDAVDATNGFGREGSHSLDNSNWPTPDMQMLPSTSDRTLFFVGQLLDDHIIQTGGQLIDSYTNAEDQDGWFLDQQDLSTSSHHAGRYSTPRNWEWGYKNGDMWVSNTDTDGSEALKCTWSIPSLSDTPNVITLDIKNTGEHTVYVNGSPHVGSCTGAQLANIDLLARRVYAKTLGETLMVRGGADSAERQQIEGYLAHKWGVEAGLPDSHPWKNSPPS